MSQRSSGRNPCCWTREIKGSKGIGSTERSWHKGNGPENAKLNALVKRTNSEAIPEGGKGEPGTWNTVRDM